MEIIRKVISAGVLIFMGKTLLDAHEQYVRRIAAEVVAENRGS